MSTLHLAPARPDGDPGLTRAERSARTTALFAELAAGVPDERRPAIVDELIVINRGVAESIASRYRERGVAMDDLCQVAYVGLCRAVQRYDGALAEDFLTYAVPTIRGEVQRHFRDHGWAVRPVRRVQEQQWRTNRAIERLEQDLGREPTEAEICAETGMSAREYAEVVQAFGCFQPTSLDRLATSEGSASLGELLGEEQSLEAVEARVVLGPVVRRLSERDRRILHLRFVGGPHPDEIGHQLGVTQMQVSRLLRRILARMREEVEGVAQ